MHPTLRELGAVCQKPHWREVGSLLARRVARPAAVYLTWVAVRSPASANAITGLTLIVGIVAALLLGTGTFVAGVVVLNLWYVLDHVDGQVARYRRSESVTGVYFDFMMHHIVHPLVAFSLGYGIAVQTNELHWALAGAAFALGVMLLSLANDCRYKAFHSAKQQGRGRTLLSSGVLGAESAGSEAIGVLLNQSISVEDSSRSRPTSDAQRPAFRALRFALRLGQKLCEIPQVIIAVSALCGVTWMRPTLGFQSVQAYVLLLSILAPSLAVIRLAKEVWLRQPDTEFHSFAVEPESNAVQSKRAD